MIAKERRNRIQEIIAKEGVVETSRLAELLEVSVETIRKDFLVLEKANQISRTHGGAVSRMEIKPKHDLIKRSTQYNAEKQQVALKAIEFISEDDIIGIDSGSTAFIFAEALKEHFSSLTVITPSLDVFQILNSHANFQMILCGGIFLKTENSFVGVPALDMLKNLHMHKSFIFPTAISLEYGIYGYCNDFTEVQRQFIKSSEKVFMLADSSKFEKKALMKICDTQKDFYYITDEHIPVESKQMWHESDMKLFVYDKSKTD